MSTTTIIDGGDEKAVPKPGRDDYRPLESIDQLGLVRDKTDHLTPIDVLFNAKEASAKPEHEPRRVL